jgi:hypothetical protein
LPLPNITCLPQCYQVDEIFAHHLYEYVKGLRALILHTTSRGYEQEIVRRLQNQNIPYVIYPVNDHKINVFFGHQVCIDVVRKINKVSLRDYTDEEDFILGTMLGYDRVLQCKRYLQLKEDRDELIG